MNTPLNANINSEGVNMEFTITKPGNERFIIFDIDIYLIFIIIKWHGCCDLILERCQGVR